MILQQKIKNVVPFQNDVQVGIFISRHFDFGQNLKKKKKKKKTLSQRNFSMKFGLE